MTTTSHPLSLISLANSSAAAATIPTSNNSKSRSARSTSTLQSQMQTRATTATTTVPVPIPVPVSNLQSTPAAAPPAPISIPIPIRQRHRSSFSHTRKRRPSDAVVRPSMSGFATGAGTGAIIGSGAVSGSGHGHYANPSDKLLKFHHPEDKDRLTSAALALSPPGMRMRSSQTQGMHTRSSSGGGGGAVENAASVGINDGSDVQLSKSAPLDGHLHGNGAGQGQGQGGKKRGLIFKCETCAKVYRHPSCLVKHRWEHSPHWREASKFLLSKHQQVQLLEAAAILSHLSPTSSGGGTSLPEDRSLWPSYLSRGLVPTPNSLPMSEGSLADANDANCNGKAGAYVGDIVAQTSPDSNDQTTSNHSSSNYSGYVNAHPSPTDPSDMSTSEEEGEGDVDLDVEMRMSPGGVGGRSLPLPSSTSTSTRIGTRSNARVKAGAIPVPIQIPIPVTQFRPGLLGHPNPSPNSTTDSVAGQGHTHSQQQQHSHLHGHPHQHTYAYSVPNPTSGYVYPTTTSMTAASTAGITTTTAGSKPTYNTGHHNSYPYTATVPASRISVNAGNDTTVSDFKIDNINYSSSKSNANNIRSMNARTKTTISKTRNHSSQSYTPHASSGVLAGTSPFSFSVSTSNGSRSGSERGWSLPRSSLRGGGSDVDLDEAGDEAGDVGMSMCEGGRIDGREDEDEDEEIDVDGDADGKMGVNGIRNGSGKADEWDGMEMEMEI